MGKIVYIFLFLFVFSGTMVAGYIVNLKLGLEDVELTDEGQVPVMSISKEHFEIHEGDHYFIKTFLENTGVSGSCDYFAFTTPDTDTRIHAKTLLAPDIDFIVTIYEDGNITGGVSISGVNNDRDSSNSAELMTVAAPTINYIGTPIWVSRNGGGKDPVGVSPGLNYEIIAKTNSTYIFGLCKQVANYGIVNIDFWWYEEDEPHE